MAKVIKNVSFSWEWTGDERLLQGFNIALCKSTETPLTEVTASTFVAMRGTSETPVVLNPSYTFSNVTLDDGLYYVPFVQAVYPGDDSEWLGATGILIDDDGTSTVATEGQLPVVFFQDSTPSGKFGDTWIDTNDDNKSYYHNGSSWVEGKYGADGVNGTRTAILEMYQAAVSVPTTFPSGSSTYTWATGQFTAPATPNSWELTPPTVDAGETLWICRTVYADTNTSTTTAITWAATYARAASSNGTDGANGARTAILEVYKWEPTGTSSFSYPSGTSTYTWATGVFGLPDWSLTPGAATAGYTLFACMVVYVDSLVTTTSTVDWANRTGVAYAVGVAGTDGIDGDDGVNGFSGVLTNESHTVAALVTGLGYSLTTAGGTFKVYFGTTDVTTSSTFAITGGSDGGTTWTKVQNGLTFTINETTGVYSLSGATWTTDSESFTATGTYSGGVVTKVYTISKSKAGAVGVDATVVSVTGEQAFKFLTGASTPVSTSIVLTATLVGGLTTYDWEYWTGSAWANLSGTQNASTYTLAYNNSAWGSATALRVRCLSGTMFDEITILKLYDGAVGQGQVKGVSFLRATSAPATPTGGSFASPTATSWSDGIPADNNQALWMTTRLFTSDGASPQQSVWTTPQKIGTPSTGIRTIFSVLGTTASIGTTDATWHVTPTTLDAYMATQASTDNGVTWGAITGKVKIKGEQGTTGYLTTSNFIDGLTGWTSLRDGNPSTISTVLGTLITDDTDFGICGEFDWFDVAGENVLPKQVVQVTPGRVYKISSTFKLTSLPPDGIANFNIVVPGQTLTYANAGTVFGVDSTNVSAIDTVTTVSVIVSSAVISGTQQLSATSRFFRAGLRLNGAGETGTFTIRVSSVLIEDVTEAFTAQVAAAVAQTQLDTLQTQTDNKISVYVQSATPSWTDDNANHVEDQWYKTTEKKWYRYTGSAWSVNDTSVYDAATLAAGKTTYHYESGTTSPNTATGVVGDFCMYKNTSTGIVYTYKKTGTSTWTVQAGSFKDGATDDTAANTKTKTFLTTPTTPYRVGDLWYTGGSVASSGDIKKCITEALTGSYNAAHWVIATKYTDDTAVTTLAGTIGGSGVNILSALYSGFEQPTAPTITPVGCTVNIDSVGRHAGSTKSLKLAATSDTAYVYFGATSTTYNLPITAGKKWIVSGWVKCSAASKNGRFYIRTATVGTYYYGSFTTSATPDTWERVSVVIDVTGDTTSTMAWMSPQHTGGTGVSMWFDDLMMEEQVGAGTAASGYAAPIWKITDSIQSVISGINLPTTGMQTGLNITKDYLGYYDGSSWKSYIDSSGNFKFGDGTTTAGIAWNQSAGTLAIRGALVADDITSGTLDTIDITGSTITGSTIQTSDTGKRLAIYASNYSDPNLAGEFRMYDDLGGIGGIVPIITIGVNLNTSSTSIATIGNVASGNSFTALRAYSNAGYALYGSSISNIGIYGLSAGTGTNTAGVFGSNTSSGPGISGYSVSGYGGIFTGNATKAAVNLVPVATLPTNRAAGSICFYNGILCFANGTHWYSCSGNTQLT